MVFLHLAIEHLEGANILKWLNKLERKYGHLGISNLMTYIVGLMMAVYILQYFNVGVNVISKLTLNPYLILHGQIWRLITFIIIPPNTSLIWLAFALYFFYIVGQGLEDEWGTFKFNVYYLIGMIATILSSFITGMEGTSVYLNLSLFLAFAWVYPNFTVLLFFILPVKVKYLGIIDGIFLAFTLIVGSLSEKIIVIAALLNFLLFFGKDILDYMKNRNNAGHNKRRFRNLVREVEDQPFHVCTVCGITDKDDPTMDFRYCAECDGHYGYCREHLHNHEHIK